MMRYKLIGWTLAVIFVIVVAGYEGGPHAAGETPLATLFGADEVIVPVPFATCNGKELEPKACLVSQGRSCGPDYQEIKPVLSGNLKDKLFDNDVRVCTAFSFCPVLYSKKQIMDPCTQVPVP